MNTEKIYALSAAARSFVLENGAPQYLAELIGELYERSRDDLDEAAARSAGRGNARTAALRLLRYVPADKLEQYGGAWIDEHGHQFFLNTYMGLRLNRPLPLPEVKRQKTMENVIQDRPCGLEELPVRETLAELKTLRSRYNAEQKLLPKSQKQKPLYSFGEGKPAVDVNFLIDALEILPGATILAKSGSSCTAPVYLESPDGLGLICPVRMNAKTKAVNA